MSLSLMMEKLITVIGLTYLICVNDHEEADTLMIWHASEIFASEMSPNADHLCIFSPDTDVLVLLVYHFHQLIPNIDIALVSSIINIKDLHVALGITIAKALLGFYAFTSCDVVRKWKSKYIICIKWQTLISYTFSQ